MTTSMLTLANLGAEKNKAAHSVDGQVEVYIAIQYS
jgi:hypothetical protein